MLPLWPVYNLLWSLNHDKMDCLEQATEYTECSQKIHPCKETEIKIL